MIAERLQVKPDPSRSLFFTVALSVAPDVPQLPPGWSMTYMDVESGGARWDLYLELNDRPGGMIGRAQYTLTSSPAPQLRRHSRISEPYCTKLQRIPNSESAALADNPTVQLTNWLG